jgi:hypothetical protein
MANLGRKRPADEEYSSLKKSQKVIHQRSPYDNDYQPQGYILIKVKKYIKKYFLDNDDDEPLDAFSAQLAAADRVEMRKGHSKNKRAVITQESIQNSLLDSLANPVMGNSKYHTVPDATNLIIDYFNPAIVNSRQQDNQSDPLNYDINMFKAPKENRRVYSGKKKNGANGSTVLEVPKLYDICIRLLLNNIDGMEKG